MVCAMSLRASGAPPCLLAAALALGTVLPANAQPPLPAGAQFQVNTYTPNVQYRSNVATDADGDFVVVWQSNGSPGTDTSSHSVQGQRYASDGSAQGAQFQVNTYTTNLQQRPSVAASADGDFVVVWVSLGSSETDTGDYSIQGQRYTSGGSTQGAQFQVNTYTTSFQKFPSVVADADGDFVVVWTSYGSSGIDTSSASIQGQRYASNGSTQGAQFQVNTYTTSAQFAPSVAAADDGDFVVVWGSMGSSGTDTSFYSIQGQRYASNGSAQGAQFQVNTYTTGYQSAPSVAADADGNFVVAWNSPGSSGTDPSESVQSQRYASDGSIQGVQFQVNTYTTYHQQAPSVAADGDGGFVVVWDSVGSFGTDTSQHSIQGQRYASDGSIQGGQFQVNTYTTSVQKFPSVAAADDGDFVVVWWGDGSSGTDTSDSIHAQRYRPPIAAPALSPVGISVLGVALLLVGGSLARAYGSVSRRSRFSR
jgi:hypothetical protein